MKEQFNEKHINLDVLLNYTYELLSDKEEEQLEIFFDHHQDYADLVETMLDFCAEHKLKTKSEAVQLFAELKPSFLSKIIAKDTTESDLKEHLPLESNASNFRSWALFILGLLLVAIAFVYYLDHQKNTQPPPVQRQTVPTPAIARVLETHTTQALADRWIAQEKTKWEDLGNSSKSWQEDLMDGRTEPAYQSLSELMQDSTQNIYATHHYVYGVLSLLTPNIKAQTAVDHLTQAGDIRPDIPFYLVIAYVENGQIAAAQKLLQKYPDLQKELPNEVVHQLIK